MKNLIAPSNRNRISSKSDYPPFDGLANGSSEADNQDATGENRCVGESGSTINLHSINYPQCSEHYGKWSSLIKRNKRVTLE